MTQDVNSLWWRSASDSAAVTTAAELCLPGAFDLIEKQYIFGWLCGNCCKPITLHWPPKKEELVKHLKIPSTKYHSLEELQRIAEMSEQLELLQRPSLSYIIDKQIKLSPSLILVDCAACCTAYLLSYVKGVGEERTSKPPTLGFRGIWMLES